MSILVTISGCENFLEEDIKTFTDPSTLLKNANGLEQAVNGIYNSGNGLYNGRNYAMIYGMPSDEMWIKAQAGSRWELSIFGYNPTNGDVLTAWNAYTTAIARANMVLDNIPPLGTLGIPNEQQFLDYKKGEALFLRAWYYFKHMMSFGNVPLLTSFNSVELFPANSTIAALYTQIIADLKEAETLLPNWKASYAVAGRANKGAAKSLLGIVYLAKGTSEAEEANDFQNAASKLKEVIDNEGYELWAKYYEAFLPVNKNKKEDIFSFQCEANTACPASMYTDFNLAPPPTGAARGYGQLPMTFLLYNSFDPADKRVTESLYGTPLVYTGAYINRATGNTHYVNDRVMHEKYLDPINGPLTHNNQSTNFPLIRYADVLLSYAEALNEANNGPNTEAYWGINQVRARAGLLPLSGLSKTQFFDAVVIERWHEFYAEGIRWYDLKRWGLLERGELKEYNPPFLPVIDVQLPKHNLFPIPQSEIDANPNLVQNPFY